jgi:hypothetical protein
MATVEDAWNRIRSWLRECAPVTFEAIEPPDADEDLLTEAEWTVVGVAFS